MNFPRAIIRDLIERRLWPVAILLTVALAAVPVLLGRQGDSTTTVAPATPAAPGDTAQKAEVTLDASVPADRDRGGDVRNPFKSPINVTTTTSEATLPTDSGSTGATTSTGDTGAASTDTTSTATTTTGSTGGGSSDSSSSDSSSPTTGSTTTTSKPKTTTGIAEDAKDTYHVSVRFGLDGGKLTTTRDVARLSPLPSATDPFFVYLGVLETTATKKEKRAVFVVTSDATPNGEGACHPTKNDCESVELTVGQTAFFDYTDANGKVSQYELQLAGIHKTEIKSEAKASAAIARHSVAGTELLRDGATRNVRFAAGARAYRYLPAAGLLQRAKRRHITARAAAAGAIPGIELVDAKDQPGLPVWRSPEKHK
jgi:hypothetical protein